MSKYKSRQHSRNPSEYALLTSEYKHANDYPLDSTSTASYYPSQRNYQSTTISQSRPQTDHADTSYARVPTTPYYQPPTANGMPDYAQFGHEPNRRTPLLQTSQYSCPTSLGDSGSSVSEQDLSGDSSLGTDSSDWENKETSKFSDKERRALKELMLKKEKEKWTIIKRTLTFGLIWISLVVVLCFAIPLWLNRTGFISRDSVMVLWNVGGGSLLLLPLVFRLYKMGVRPGVYIEFIFYLLTILIVFDSIYVFMQPTQDKRSFHEIASEQKKLMTDIWNTKSTLKKRSLPEKIIKENPYVIFLWITLLIVSVVMTFVIMYRGIRLQQFILGYADINNNNSKGVDAFFESKVDRNIENIEKYKVFLESKKSKTCKKPRNRLIK